jgi:FlaA1/EpsC-like NDP-sugar epimerase
MIVINNRYISFYKIAFIIVDTTLIGISLFVANYVFGNLSVSLTEPHTFWPSHLFLVMTMQVAFYYFGIYKISTIKNFGQLILRLFFAYITSVICVFLFFYPLFVIFPIFVMPRLVLLFGFGLALVLTLIWRIIYRRLIRIGFLNERVLILGSGKLAEEIADQIAEKADSGFKVVGVIDYKYEEKGRKHGKRSA